MSSPGDLLYLGLRASLHSRSHLWAFVSLAVGNFAENKTLTMIAGVMVTTVIVSVFLTLQMFGSSVYSNALSGRAFGYFTTGTGVGRSQSIIFS